MSHENGTSKLLRPYFTKNKIVNVNFINNFITIF